MLIYVPLVVIATIYLVYCYITRTFNYWKYKNVAYPEPLPFFGNMKDFILRRIHERDALKEIYDKYPNEKVVGIYRMTTPFLLIRDLDIIKQIMIKDFNIFVDRGIHFGKERLGNNLFHSHPNTWRVLRAKFSPIFTSGKLKNMFPLVSDRADNFIRHMINICRDNPEQDLNDLSKMYTMSTISTCAFGMDIDINSDNPALAALAKIDELIFTRNIAAEIDMMCPGILEKVSASPFSKEVDAFFNDLVKTVFKQRNGVPSNRNDFMDLLLELKRQKIVKKNNIDSELSVELTDTLIAAQAFIFYSAGFTTSSGTLTFMLYELSQNQDVQDKLIAEIDEALDRFGGKINYEVLMELPYLSMVLDETLRKYPAVGPLRRVSEVDYKIPGTDVVIKGGQAVWVPILGIHYDEKYYPNPEVFDPTRFSPENSRDRHSCAYLPFGTGPRNCIGMRFAKLQSRMFVVKLLSKYRVEVSEKTPKSIKFDPNINIISPKGGMFLNFVARQDRKSPF